MGEHIYKVSVGELGTIRVESDNGRIQEMSINHVAALASKRPETWNFAVEDGDARQAIYDLCVALNTLTVKKVGVEFVIRLDETPKTA